MLKSLALAAVSLGNVRPVGEPQEPRIPFGRGYRRVVEQRESGISQIYCEPKHYGEFIPNRGSIRNVYDANGVKTGIRYV